ncbi:MAG: hypothetical protein KC416_09020 [Myxococcales bacterium]|nr:hypothetical protein [Myxococcales bacterium]
MFRPLLALALVVLPACGGPSMPEGQVLSDVDRNLFNNAIDFISDPMLLGGQWQDEWVTELESRVKRADNIFILRFDTIRTDVTPGEKDTYRLVGSVQARLWGAYDQKDVSLRVMPSDPSYPTMDANRRRTLNEHFLAFIKWEKGPPGQPAIPRWHLIKASKAMNESISAQIDQTKPGGVGGS